MSNLFTENLTALNYCDCPLDCKIVDYKYTTSMARFPTLSYFDQKLKNNPVIKSNFINKSNELTFENLRQSVCRIVLFYERLQDVLITESPKIQIVNLISNIGGVIGLFLGLSFASFVELIEICYFILDTFYFENKCKNLFNKIEK